MQNRKYTEDLCRFLLIIVKNKTPVCSRSVLGIPFFLLLTSQLFKTDYFIQFSTMRTAIQNICWCRKDSKELLHMLCHFTPTFQVILPLSSYLPPDLLNSSNKISPFFFTFPQTKTFESQYTAIIVHDTPTRLVGFFFSFVGLVDIETHNIFENFQLLVIWG